MRIVPIAFAALFAWAAYLNLNDPDAAPWIAVYLGAALACLRPTPVFSATLVGYCAWWAWQIHASLELQVPLLEALSDWGMHSKGSEEVRELGGLLLVCVVVSALALVRKASR